MQAAEMIREISDEGFFALSRRRRTALATACERRRDQRFDGAMGARLQATNGGLIMSGVVP